MLVLLKSLRPRAARVPCETNIYRSGTPGSDRAGKQRWAMRNRSPGESGGFLERFGGSRERVLRDEPVIRRQARPCLRMHATAQITEHYPLGGH